MTPLHLSLSLLFGPVSFLKLLESEGESFPPSLKKLFSFFLFALYDQGVWGGKHRFSSPDGNAFADNGLRRGIVFGLKAPSTSPKGRVWFFGRHAARRRNLQPGGQAEGAGSAGAERSSAAASGAGRLRGFSPLLPRIPEPRLCAGDLSCGRLGWKVSGPRASTHLPRLPGTKLTSLGPHPPPAPRPRPRPSRARSAWVCAWNASMCWRHDAPASLPARVLPRPLRRSLSFRLRGPEAGVGDANGAGGPSRGREAGGRRRALGRWSPARTISGA